MTQLDISYPEDLCIPIDPTSGDPELWAAATADGFGEATGLDPDGVSRVRAALTGLMRLAEPSSRLLLVVAPEARFLAPLRITVSDDALSRDEQAAYLWSTDAILPPTAELLETPELGAGITVALLQKQGDIQFATRRWLFPGENGAVGALLGPVQPYGLAVVQPTADAVIEQLHVEGFIPAADRTDLERWEAAAGRSGESWTA